MKVKIPEELKAGVPQTTWGKILSATPVVMTVVATLLAGLASSEMTRAQYDRSLAAQQQSKAGDQWSYFQAKKLRSALQRNAVDILQATAEVQPLDAGALTRIVAPQSFKVEPATIVALQKCELPPLPAGPALEPPVAAALQAIENQQPESEISNHLAQVQPAALAAALTAAQERTTAFDAATKPVNQGIEQLEKAIARSSDRELIRDLTVARLLYTAARYDAESRLNQTVANLLELQVRQNNISAERHHRRSGRFFFGMLAAQAAVILATFAMAARQRNLLWSIAAVAGITAIIFAIYVYLRV
ncbi:MAG TPA: DUF4337 family protein [Dongiaceae bacterium]|jgi:hypothetical protein|nr:DUF4337 family protein [Dongiaceae bacterium]